jgi:hypothetical protein
LAKDEGKFIDARKINPLSQGTKLIHTGDFKRLVEKIVPTLSGFSKAFQAG